MRKLRIYIGSDLDKALKIMKEVRIRHRRYGKDFVASTPLALAAFHRGNKIKMKESKRNEFTLNNKT